MSKFLLGEINEDGKIIVNRDNLHHLLEMATIGEFSPTKSDGTEYKIYVCHEPQRNPTFHLEHENKGDSDYFLAIVQIEDFMVLKFEKGKAVRLSHKVFNAMITFFKSNDEDQINEQTYWQTLIIEWNKANKDKKFPKDYPMPKVEHFTYGNKLKF